MEQQAAGAATIPIHAAAAAPRLLQGEAQGRSEEARHEDEHPGANTRKAASVGGTATDGG
jgi:hypothetical protein